MRQRRWLVIASAFILVAIVGFVVLQRGPLAQPPPPPGDTSAGGPPADMPPDPGMAGPEAMAPGMGPDMGMGGTPAGGGGGGLEWSITPSPEDKSMTYQEFCNRTGAAPNVPKQFTVDDNGEDILATKNSWSQLQRPYAGGAVGVATAEVEPGRVGKRLAAEAVRHAAYDYNVLKALAAAYLDARDGFSCKVGYPVSSALSNMVPDDYRASGLGTSQIGPGSMSVIVVMQVRPQMQRTYGERVYNRLKKFDCLGYASQIGESMVGTSLPFNIHTFAQGFYKPRTLNLSPYAPPFWGMLWWQNRIQLDIKNRAGDVIHTQYQPAGQGPTILSEIINPPQLYYSPKWKVLIPPEDLRFNGGRLNLNGTRGWAYMFNIDLPPTLAIQMHTAEARLVGLDEQGIEARVQTLGDTLTPTAGQAGGGMPGEPGMPGGPGAPPEAMPGGVPPPPM